MRQMNRCQICGCIATRVTDNRCRLCMEAKAAADTGISYGKMKAILFSLYGDVPDPSDEILRACPICKRLFLPKRQNQIYDNRLCAQRAASKNYYLRKRKGEGHEGYGLEKEIDHGANPSD